MLSLALKVIIVLSIVYMAMALSMVLIIPEEGFFPENNYHHFHLLRI